ncbi:uncharacterized protein LOC118754748 [Rhagoletis pomonella]|uniref:uncharacterized protein LOC118754748 n=1 Tax=Rhagoletis pomonella TaxID=28610 RepID=UPI001781DD43|nr:uncharacterized protein LOC118754748 [Rhagoletis pomonella]
MISHPQKLRLMWVPGHAGINGNLAADTTAKVLFEALQVQNQQILKQHQEEKNLMQQHIQQQQNLIERILQGQPAQIADQAVLAQDSTAFKVKCLADSMVNFEYDPDNNQTFEAYYERYESVFTNEAEGLDEPTKVYLLFQKFNQEQYQRYADSILPLKPQDCTFENTVTILKKLFGYKKTKFAMRHRCFNHAKFDYEDFSMYAARINKHAEKFDISHCTADDFKVLLFVSGLKDVKDSLILEKLLTKVDNQYLELERVTDAAARADVHKLNFRDLINEAELNKDKSTVRNQSNDTPRLACFRCGEIHWIDNCPCKDKQCGECNEKGHKTGFCAFMKNFNGYKSSSKKNPSSNQVEATVHAISNRKYINPVVNGTVIKLQVDTASDITIISKSNWILIGQPLLSSEIRTNATSASVEVDDDSKEIVAINTHVGMFKVNRLQQGVKAAPAEFQAIVEKMLSGTSTFGFIDDMVTAGENLEDHKQQLFKTLEQLQIYGFQLNISKCCFGKSSVNFCGHIIDEKGIRPNPEKIWEVQSAPQPKDVSQLRSFLGSVNYYGKFIESMKQLRGPLDDLLKKEAKFEWQSIHQEAFDQLRKILSSDLVLTHFDPRKDIVLATDASIDGMGAAIMHCFKDGSLHPIMHFAATFNEAEKNYSQIEEEVDVSSLKSTTSPCSLSLDQKVVSQFIRLTVYNAGRSSFLAYDINFEFIGTNSFGYVDVVSRLMSKYTKPDEDTVIAPISCSNENVEDISCFAIQSAKQLPITFKDIQEATNDLYRKINGPSFASKLMKLR